MIPRLVGCDGVQPRSKPPGQIKASRRLEDLNKGLLHNVFGDGGTSNEPPNEPKQVVAVALNQPFKSGLASREEIGQQAFIRSAATPVFSSVHLLPAILTHIGPSMFYRSCIGSNPESIGSVG